MNKKTSPIALLYPLAIILLSVGLSLRPIADYDIWWHLKTGEVIWNLKEILRYDIFSYSAFGAPWINHEWLSQIILWLVFKFTQINGLIFLFVLITIGISTFIFKGSLCLTKSKMISLWSVFLIMASIADRIIARPYLIGYLALAAMLYLIHNFIIEKRKAVFLIPIVQILWVNAHGGAILGPIIICGFWFGERVQSFFGAGDPLDEKEIKNLSLIALLTIAAAFINPYTFKAFTFPLEHLQMKNILLYTGEWIPTFYPQLDNLTSTLVFKLTLYLSIISCIANIRNSRLSHILLIVLMGILSAKSKRFIPDFQIVVIPILMFNFQQAFKRYKHEFKYRKLIEILNLSIIISATSIFIQIGFPMDTRAQYLDTMGLGVNPTFAPTGLSEFIRTSKINGKMFNLMHIGGYLIFANWPDTLVRIDGRTPVFGDSFYHEHIQSLYKPDKFERLDEKNDFDYLVLGDEFCTLKSALLKHLVVKDQWVPVYKDWQNCVFVKRKDRWKDLIEKYELPCSKNKRKKGAKDGNRSGKII